MGWLDDLNAKNDVTKKYLSTKIGCVHVLEDVVVELDHEAKFPISKDKEYAIRVTGKVNGEEKILNLNTITAEIAMQKIGEEMVAIDKTVDGNTFTYKHPKEGLVIIDCCGKRVAVQYDRLKKTYLYPEIQDIDEIDIGDDDKGLPF